jgi:hypothetical protein
MQLLFGYYNYYATIPLEIWCINKKNCHIRKLVSCIIIASDLKMGLLYDNLHRLYIHM